MKSVLRDTTQNTCSYKTKTQESSSVKTLNMHNNMQNICNVKNTTDKYGYQHLPETPVNHPGQASEWETESVSCE